MSRDSLLFLEDILLSCRKILRYCEGQTRDEVYRDSMRFEAVLYNLHVVGEAVKKLPEHLRERYSDVSWREIAGMRDIIVHAYFALDLDILWSAIEDEVPHLSKQVQGIIEAERGSLEH